MFETLEDIAMLKKILELDASTGNLRWKEKMSRKVVVGSIAGSSRGNGYKYVQVNKIKFGCHRIVFAFIHGYWPKEIDHIDGNPANNKPDNLREADRTTNNYNRCKPKHGAFEMKGVFKQKRGRTWAVRLTTNGVQKRIGGFDTAESAKEFLDRWRYESHGQFANTGDNHV